MWNILIWGSRPSDDVLRRKLCGEHFEPRASFTEWLLLMENILFAVTGLNKKPTDILFIKSKGFYLIVCKALLNYARLFVNDYWDQPTAPQRTNIIWKEAFFFSFGGKFSECHANFVCCCYNPALLGSPFCFSEDCGSRFGSRPAVLRPQYSRHHGHEQWRLGGPGSRFSWCCCSPLVSISPWKQLLLLLPTENPLKERVLRWLFRTNPRSRRSSTPLCPRRSQSVVRIYTTVRFEPSKINIFVKDCQRGGKDVTCMSAIVCFNITARTAISPTQEIGKPAKIIHVTKPPLVFARCLAPSLEPHLIH